VPAGRTTRIYEQGEAPVARGLLCCAFAPAVCQPFVPRPKRGLPIFFTVVFYGHAHFCCKSFGRAGAGQIPFLGIFGAVESFGITAICYGLWQIVTERRSKWVIYFLIGLCVALGVVAVSI
jgi:hypothetical protein